jgi:hypothetical protein
LFLNQVLDLTIQEERKSVGMTRSLIQSALLERLRRARASRTSHRRRYRVYLNIAVQTGYLSLFWVAEIMVSAEIFVITKPFLHFSPDGSSKS